MNIIQRYVMFCSVRNKILVESRIQQHQNPVGMIYEMPLRTYGTLFSMENLFFSTNIKSLTGYNKTITN